MISPIGSAQQAYQVAPSTNQRAAAAPQQSSTSAPHDTVSLSSAARGGDIDHDGDSH
jgi:hypothetical protein